MKKLLSSLLTFTLLLSMVPSAFAEPAVSEENTSSSLLLEEDASDISDETVPVPRAIARPEANILPTELPIENNTSLYASRYSVTINLALPQAATAATEDLYVCLYTPATIDSTGFITDEPEIYTGKWLMVEQGATSASHTFSVPAGNYIPAVYAYGSEVGIISGNYHYFNADGTVASNGYTATTTTISGNKTLDLKFPEDKRTISGTLSFSSPLEEDTEFEFYLYSSGNYSDNETWSYFTVPAGESSLDFSIPVAADSYDLQIYNNEADTWGYYDITGSISETYDSRAYISTFQDSVTGLTINGDSLLGESSDDNGDSRIVTVSVTLPEETSSAKEYYLLLYDMKYDELWDYTLCSVDSGTKTFTGSVWAEEDMEFAVGYLDVTDFSSFAWAEAYPAARFQGESGITSLVDNAKVYTMGSEDMSISVDDSINSNYKLTGTLNLSAKKSLDCAAFAMAEFDNGESFGARVNFPAGTSSVNYSIYVPTTQSGEFTHWAAEASSGRGMQINGDTVLEGSSYTVKNNLSLSAITLPVASPNVIGTLSLPDGMTAPSGGLAFRFRVNNDYLGYYYMAAGKSSIDFSFTAALAEDNADNQIRVYVQNAPDNLADQFRVSGTDDGDMTDLSLVVPETVVVSGTITVPAAAKDKCTVFELYAYGYYEDEDPVFGNYRNYGNYTYVSTLPGQTTTGYALKVLKDYESEFYSEVIADSSGKVLAATQYLQADGTVDTSYDDEVVLTENTTANFLYGEGKTFSGTISLASGLSSFYYSGRIYAEPIEGSDTYESYFSFNGTSTTYSVAVPADYTGTYNVYFELYNGPSNALTDTSVYYSSSGMTLDYDSASELSAPAENINLVIQTAKVISGSVILPEEFDGEYISGNVYAIDSEGDSYNSYFDTDDRLDYLLKVPTDYTGTYKLAVELHNLDDAPEGLITGTMLYLTENGTLSASEDDAAEYTVPANGLSKNLTIPLGKTYTVTLKAPEGYSGNYDGYIRLHDLDSRTSLTRKSFEFTGTSTTVTFTLPQGTTTNYTFRLYLYSGPGVIAGTNYYYADGIWVTNSDNAKALDLSASSIAITLPKARTISVTLKTPEGFSGKYDGRVQLYNLSTDSTLAAEYFEFEGDSHTVTFTVPNDSTSYSLRFNLYSGPGVVTGINYYYAGDTWVTSPSGATALPSDTAAITMPKARVISVTVNAPTGLSGTYEGSVRLYNKTANRQITSQSFEFSGASTTVSFSIPDDASIAYTLGLYLYSGPGIVSYYEYYYAGDTWVTSLSSATALTSDTVTVTIPKGKTISGKLISSSGETIYVDPENSSLRLSAASGSSQPKYSYNVDASGNYTITIPSDYTGTLYLHCRASSGTNVLSKNYYYQAEVTTPVSVYDYGDQNLHFTVGESDVTGIDILVETGYVLTGIVKLDSNATLSGEDYDPGESLGYTYVSFESTDYDTSGSVYLTSGSTSWSYSVALPKTAATYSMTTEVDLYSDVTSNLYIGYMNCGTVTVSGNGTLPDIVLKPAKATINVTLTSPTDDSVNGSLYLKTGENTTYDTYFYLSSGETETFPITISPTDSAETYQLYYYAYSADGILSYKNIYVASDGSLTTDSTAAGSFSMTKTSHAITLKEQPPFATGKIYLPDNLDDEDFEVCLYSSYGSQDIEVSSDTIQTAPDGRKYVTYALYSNYIDVGYTYYLYYYLYDYSGTLMSGDYDYVYLTTDGKPVYEYSYDDCVVTVPDSGVTVLDFSLATWNDGNEGSVLQSAHGINNSTGTLTYTYTYPGATALYVTFDARTDIDPQINGTTLYSVAGSRRYVDVSETGGTMTISITPSSNSYIYGFGIVNIEPRYSNEKVTSPAVASVWTPQGTDDASALAALKSGETVRIAMVAPDDTNGTLYAVVYDTNGKMLEVLPITSSFTNGQAYCDLDFETDEDITSLKLMYLAPTSYMPQISSSVICTAP